MWRTEMYIDNTKLIQNTDTISQCDTGVIMIYLTSYTAWYQKRNRSRWVLRGVDHWCDQLDIWVSFAGAPACQ